MIVFKEDSYPKFLLRQFLDICSSFFLVARIENKIIGYCIGHLNYKTSEGWILSLGVLPSFRGQKIGRKLTKKIIQNLEEEGVKSILLTVHPNNEVAVKIYEENSFKVIGTDDNYYLNNSPRKIMEKINEQ